MKRRLAALIAAVTLLLSALYVAPAAANPDGSWPAVLCHSHYSIREGGPWLGGNFTTYHARWYDSYPWRYTRVWYVPDGSIKLYYWGSYAKYIPDC